MHWRNSLNELLKIPHLHIIGNKTKNYLLPNTSKTKWQCLSWKTYYKSGGSKVRVTVSYLQRMRKENRLKWKEAEGRKKMAIFYSQGEVTTVMCPVSTSPPTPFTVTALSGLGSVAKIQLIRLKPFGASQGLAGFLSNCSEFRLTELSSSRMEGGLWEMKLEILTHHGCPLKDFTGNSRLLASWRGYLWSLVVLLQIW